MLSRKKKQLSSTIRLWTSGREWARKASKARTTTETVRRKPMLSAKIQTLIFQSWTVVRSLVFLSFRSGSLQIVSSRVIFRSSVMRSFVMPAPCPTWQMISFIKAHSLCSSSSLLPLIGEEMCTLWCILKEKRHGSQIAQDLLSHFYYAGLTFWFSFSIYFQGLKFKKADKSILK